MSSHSSRPDHTVAGRSDEHITDLVVRQVNHHQISHDAGNALLGALGIDPVNGDRQVTFRVPATISTATRRPGRAIDHANRTARQLTDEMTWTRFDGCPDGYGIDPPNPDEPDTRTLTVHTDLYLTVTVPAYPPGEGIDTAYALLARDLRDKPDLPLRLHTDRIAHEPQPNSVEHDDGPAVDVRGRDLFAAARTAAPIPARYR